MALGDPTSSSPDKILKDLVRVLRAESRAAKSVALTKHAWRRPRRLEPWWGTRHGGGVVLVARLRVEGRGHHGSLLLRHEARIRSKLHGVSRRLIVIGEAVAGCLPAMALSLSLEQR